MHMCVTPPPKKFNVCMAKTARFAKFSHGRIIHVSTKMLIVNCSWRTLKCMGREEFKLRARWLANFTGLVTRIEPTVGSTAGAPDVHLTNAAIDGWVEFKIVEACGTYVIRPSQLVWHSKYSSIRNNSCFCIMCPQGFWLIPSRLAIKLQKVVGDPVNWETVHSPNIINYGLRHVFKGNVFCRNSIERMIEPTVMAGVGHGKTEQIQGRGASS